MASRVKVTMFVAFFILLVVVVAAHEGHDHLAPGPSEVPSSNYASSINYHAVLGGLLPILLTFFIVK